MHSGVWVVTPNAVPVDWTAIGDTPIFPGPTDGQKQVAEVASHRTDGLHEFKRVVANSRPRTVLRGRRTIVDR